MKQATTLYSRDQQKSKNVQQVELYGGRSFGLVRFTIRFHESIESAMMSWSADVLLDTQ